MDDGPVLAHEAAILLALGHPSAGRDDRGCFLPESLRRSSVSISRERVLPLLGEYLSDALAGFLLDEGISVEERNPKILGKDSSDGGLAVPMNPVR